jgi:riboflavin kinase/FMN adenylyltransferase
VDDVVIVEEGVPVRSTVIRALLREGHAAAAHRLLGRPHRVGGRVVPGDQRGRQIGFPTANLDVDPDLLVPGSGVYAAYAYVDRRRQPAVVNIGIRPTFGGTESVIETHLLDFSEDLYGKTVELDFIVRLRSERKFAGIEELVAAIGNDVQSARHVLEGLT